MKGAQVTSNVKIAVEGNLDQDVLDNSDSAVANSPFKLNLKKGGFEPL